MRRMLLSGGTRGVVGGAVGGYGERGSVMARSTGLRRGALVRLLIALAVVGVLGLPGVAGADASVGFGWARAWGGASGYNGPFGVAVDGAGNVYTTGYFQGTADFDPGAGTYNLTSAGVCDVFVSKLDAAGNLVWARSLGGTDYDYGLDVAVDVAGNVYTTGFFGGTADFDPGAGIYDLTGGFRDVFVSKLDAAGNFAWARRWGGTSEDWGYDLTVDGAGNVYTTGFFAGTVDFDPGPGVVNLISAGGTDVFVSKLNAAGDLVWARRWGGASTSSDWGYGVTVDGAGNVYTTGMFWGTADFDPGEGTYILTSVGSADGFVSKLDAAGNFVWARSWGGAPHNEGKSVAVDAAGNVYTTGYFEGTADFDPGAGSFPLTSSGSADVFVSKLDAAGNLVWARSWGDTGYDVGWGVAIDGAGNVYTAGSFQGTADFDPGAGTYNLTAAGGADVFVTKLIGSTDTTPPEITPSVVGTLGSSDWYTSDVVVGWTATDDESPVTSMSGCDPTTLSADTSGITLTCTATSAGGTSSESVTLKRDTTAPGIVWNSAINNHDIFPVGSVPAQPTCIATDDGAGPNGCTVTGYGTTVGPHTLTATAFDLAGNMAVETREYSVNYVFDGFFQPIDMIPVNVAKAGQAVPVKWRLTDGNGVAISDPASFVALRSRLVTCSDAPGVSDAVEEYAAGGSGLSYQGGGYWQFNWKTLKTYAGTCRAMWVQFDDGTSSPIVYFRFKS
jgi:hypothetical protein